jgi:hypothetical protein
LVDGFARFFKHFAFVHRNARGAESLKLHQIFRENQIERPIERDAQFFLKARKFLQINRSPEPPREEARKIHPENPRYDCPLNNLFILDHKFFRRKNLIE